MRSSGASQQSSVAEQNLEVSCNFCPPKPFRILPAWFCSTPNIQELRRKQQVMDKVQVQHQTFGFLPEFKSALRADR